MNRLCEPWRLTFFLKGQSPRCSPCGIHCVWLHCLSGHGTFGAFWAPKLRQWLEAQSQSAVAPSNIPLVTRICRKLCSPGLTVAPDLAMRAMKKFERRRLLRVTRSVSASSASLRYQTHSVSLHLDIYYVCLLQPGVALLKAKQCDIKKSQCPNSIG